MRQWFQKEALNYMGAVFLVALLALGLTGEYRLEAEQVAAAVFQPAKTALTDGGGAMLIVVDAGHGGKDMGGRGANGVEEAPINLKVAQLVEGGLRQAGFTVVMTREDEKALGDSKKADMARRKEIMLEDGVAAVVSIHMNKFSDPSIKGPMAFYMKGSDQGEKLATAVIQSVCKSIGHAERGANPGDYFIVRESSAPAVIVECGFLSNPGDEQRLQDPAHQQALADGIVAGVAQYFS